MVLQFFHQHAQALLRQELAGLAAPVQLRQFCSAASAEYDAIISGLLGELVALHPLLSLEVCDLVADVAAAAQLGVDTAPAIAVLGGPEQHDSGIRFCGLPSGALFPVLLEAVLLVGGATTPTFQPLTLALLHGLHTPLGLHIFVTADCPACGPAVLLAYQLALASPYVTATAVEVRAFPEMAARYAITDTPTIVLDDGVQLAGAALEPQLQDALCAILDPHLRARRSFSFAHGPRADDLPRC